MQAGRQAGRQAGGQAGRRTGRQAGRQAGSKMKILQFDNFNLVNSKALLTCLNKFMVPMAQ